MKKLICLSFAFCLIASAGAQTPRNALAHKLKSLRTMRAAYSQVVRSAGGGVIQNTRGRMAMSRPGRFYWSSTRPTKQVIIADGKKVWVYDKDLRQVTIKSMRHGLGSTPAAVLTRRDTSILRQFRIGQKGGQFVLVPIKKKSAYKKIYLRFSGLALREMTFWDNLGQRTRIRFSGVSVNRRIPLSQFQLRIPRGVDIVNQRR
jgi:outer membrane lipoprotein carrier protein